MEAHVEAPARHPSHAEKAATAYKLPDLWDKDAIKKDQDGIKKGLTKLDANIHANAVQCLMHAEKHGDTSLMRRLLIDIVDAKSGYRRQGIIGWMRMFSPMELVKDTINLSGTDNNGVKRTFQIEKADQTPFTSIRSLDEKLGRPVFRDTLTSKIALSIKEFKAAAENTDQNGKPIDKTKPYYDGINIDKVRSAYDKFESNLIELQSWRDSTAEVRKAQETVRKAQLEYEAVTTEAKITKEANVA